MSPELLQKIAIAVISVSLGWVLAQLTATARTYLHRHKIITLLHEELRDLSKETTRLLYYHGRNLQLYGAQGIGSAGVVGLSHPIFTSYYKDALLSLNQSQRISLQMIHGLVDSQNGILRQIEDINAKAHEDFRKNGTNETTKEYGETLGELTKHGYSNCAIIQWHIDFHLKRDPNPDLSPNTEDHRLYLKYLTSVKDEMEKVVESGKTIPKENFENIYSESQFKPKA